MDTKNPPTPSSSITPKEALLALSQLTAGISSGYDYHLGKFLEKFIKEQELPAPPSQLRNLGYSLLSKENAAPTPPKPEPTFNLAGYLKQFGNACLYCGAVELNHGNITFEGGATLNQQVFCHKCGQKWFDIYRLEGVHT